MYGSEIFTFLDVIDNARFYHIHMSHNFAGQFLLNICDKPISPTPFSSCAPKKSLLRVRNIYMQKSNARQFACESESTPNADLCGLSPLISTKYELPRLSEKFIQKTRLQLLCKMPAG